MAEGMSNQQIWKEYREPLVHKTATYYELQIRTAHAVVSWAMGGNEGTFRKTNDPSAQHVEHVVIERLSEILRTNHSGEKMIVEIYLNFSPCDLPFNECCSALIRFQKHNPVDLSIIFGGLYKINREYCKQSGCLHFQQFPVKEDESETNKKGLQTLVAAGIPARTFTVDDWKFVYQHLFKTDPKPGECLERAEDATMRADYEAII